MMANLSIISLKGFKIVASANSEKSVDNTLQTCFYQKQEPTHVVFTYSKLRIETL